MGDEGWDGMDDIRVCDAMRCDEMAKRIRMIIPMAQQAF
jgi:hypothetical protein